MPARPSLPFLGALLLTVFAAGAGTAQSAPAPAAPDTMPGPKVGDVAPDFSVPAATRYGLLRNGLRLSDYRGQTVVLAFIVQARTRG